MFDVDLQLFGGRGGSGGSGFGGGYDWGMKSEWADGGVVINMDDYMDVLKTVMLDDDYLWMFNDLNFIKTIWEHFNRDPESDFDQFHLEKTDANIAMANGMSANIPDVFYYSGTYNLSSATFHNKRDKGTKYIIADYLQNKIGRNLDYRKATIDAEVIRATPTAVRDLARKGEKTIMRERDSLKKYKAMERKASRDEHGKLSNAFYEKFNDLSNKYGYSGDYEHRWNKKYK